MMAKPRLRCGHWGQPEDMNKPVPPNTTCTKGCGSQEVVMWRAPKTSTQTRQTIYTPHKYIERPAPFPEGCVCGRPEHAHTEAAHTSQIRKRKKGDR